MKAIITIAQPSVVRFPVRPQAVSDASPRAKNTVAALPAAAFPELPKNLVTNWNGGAAPFRNRMPISGRT
jgi:hypothetical protein